MLLPQAGNLFDRLTGLTYNSKLKLVFNFNTLIRVLIEILSTLKRVPAHCFAKGCSVIDFLSFNLSGQQFSCIHGCSGYQIFNWGLIR